MRRFSRHNAVYAGLLTAAFVLAMVASWTPFGAQIDNNAYDRMFQFYRPAPWESRSILLAIDEPALNAYQGLRGIRRPLARALELIAPAAPRALAIDLILSDADVDPANDQRLENAFRATPNLVLPCDLYPGARSWEEPLARFRRWAKAVGHVHAGPDVLDSVSRELPLEMAAGRDRRWALALEAFRLSRSGSILESPEDLEVAGVRIPSRFSDGRLMRIRYLPPNMPPIPRVSLKQLLDDPRLAARFGGKAVFVGVTAQTAARDRLMTPYSSGVPMVGLEIHASAFETIAQGLFLTDAPHSWVLGFCMLLVAAAGLAFARLAGWPANLAAVGILAAAHATPYLFFTRRVVFSFAAPVSSAWLSIVTAAAYQHLVVRRRLRKSEAERVRYQQAMHFVTHEMRTPLTAIQGSSELISRYAMSEEKRKQIAQLINSESKRLGRMIEMFLNVERLSAGEMELKKETFSTTALLTACVERARPLAERKQICTVIEAVEEMFLTGDRELMEYAFYNLVTNAIKYSPPQTQVTASARRIEEHVRIAVADQGIGMDQREVKKIFQKFYRTKKAEESGEAGTGIGLSIVEQIVVQHGGSIEVTSRPGQGSCFTLVLPAAVSVPTAEKH